MTAAEHNSDLSARQAHAEGRTGRLFGPRVNGAPDNDPELMEILRGFIFGDVFDTDGLDDQTRELITVRVLACLQTLPQLTSHTGAALNVGVEPVHPRSGLAARALHRLPPHPERGRDDQRGVQARGIALPRRRRAQSPTPSGTARASPSRHPCTATRSRTTWPTCPNRSTRPCPGSSPSSASATSTPGAGSPWPSANYWCCVPWPRSATPPPSSAHTAEPASKRATPRPPWWPPWSTASPTSDSRAQSQRSARSRTCSHLNESSESAMSSQSSNLRDWTTHGSIDTSADSIRQAATPWTSSSGFSYAKVIGSIPIGDSTHHP